MDECDSIWSTKVEAEQPASGVFIQREIELYNLLKGAISPQPLGQDSAVRSLIQVHLTSFHTFASTLDMPGQSCCARGKRPPALYTPECLPFMRLNLLSG